MSGAPPQTHHVSRPRPRLLGGSQLHSQCLGLRKPIHPTRISFRATSFVHQFNFEGIRGVLVRYSHHGKSQWPIIRDCVVLLPISGRMFSHFGRRVKNKAMVEMPVALLLVKSHRKMLRKKSEHF